MEKLAADEGLMWADNRGVAKLEIKRYQI